MLTGTSRTILIDLLVCLLAFNTFAITSGEMAPTFSFWRNLVIWKQILVPLEYPRELAPLPPDMAERCCSVRPGQSVALVRRGRLLGSGQIGPITAASIPRAGNDRTAFFEVVGFPDSARTGSGPPPFPSKVERDYDMYVIGDLDVERLVPTSTRWDQPEALAAGVAEAIVAQVIRRSDVKFLAWERAREGGCDIPISLQPDTLIAVLQAECELIEYSITTGEQSSLTVQTCQRLKSRFGPYFIRVTGSRLAAPVLIRGELDFFLQVEGIPYMVLRDLLLGTGAWGYVVYRLHMDSPPEKVHSDGSWSA